MDGKTIVLDGVNIGTGAYLRRTDAYGSLPVVALSVTDILDIPSILARVVSIANIREECPTLSALCVRNDSMSPEMFASAAYAASGLWDGALILHTSSSECAEAAFDALDGRKAIIGPADISCIDNMAEVASRCNVPIIVKSADISELMDLAERAELAGVNDIILDPDAVNMKRCLESCTDIRRLMTERNLSQASHPVAVRSWSGEYAVAVSAVAVLRYASLLIIDDLDADSCRVLDILAHSAVPVLYS